MRIGLHDQFGDFCKPIGIGLDSFEADWENMKNLSEKLDKQTNIGIVGIVAGFFMTY